MCVLGKHGFVGCDCLIPGASPFIPSPLVWSHTTVLSSSGPLGVTGITLCLLDR